mmetsp:Transcript_6903/g.12679  ORF Transcript_6903/g.12679 Transcript_6903/m.12679 type:complete len:212 (-) Transcript_6903:351-986(-)
MHCLENEFLSHTLDGNYAFAPIQIGALLYHHLGYESVESFHVQLPIEGETDGGYGVIVLVLGIEIDEFLVICQDPVERETTYIDNPIQIHTRIFRLDHLRFRVESSNCIFDGFQAFFVHKISLVKQQNICERNLLHGFIFSRFFLVQTLDNPLAVDNCNDSIDTERSSHLIIREEGLRYRSGVSHSGGLDDDSVEFFASLDEFADSFECFD